MTFAPTRSAGLSRLSAFTPKTGRDYARLRNSDLGRGHHHHVSTLSPYIRLRLITELEVVKATLETYSAAESEKFVQEVFWRTYFKGWLEHIVVSQIIRPWDSLTWPFANRGFFK